MDNKLNAGGEMPPVQQLNNDGNLKPVDETSSIDFAFSESNDNSKNEVENNHNKKEYNYNEKLDKEKLIREELNANDILLDETTKQNNDNVNIDENRIDSKLVENLVENNTNNENTESTNLTDNQSFIGLQNSDNLTEKNLNLENQVDNNSTKQNSGLTAEDYNIDPEFNVYHSPLRSETKRTHYSPELDEYSWNGAEEERVLNNKTIFVGVPQTKPTNWWLVFTIVVGIYFISSLFIFNILLMPVMVEGASMEPTINNNVGSTKYDVVYLQRTQKVEKNDIVVIDATNYDSSSESKSYIKRVVATGGDTIQFKRYGTKLYWVSTSGGLGVYYAEYVLYLNGERLNEDYITTKLDSLANLQSKAYENLIYEEDSVTGEKKILDLTTETDESGVMILAIEAVQKEVFYNNKVINGSVIEIPTGKVFVLGDNRTISNDSKYFGLVSVDDIIGKVKIHKTYDSGLLPAIFYSIKKGYLF